MSPLARLALTVALLWVTVAAASSPAQTFDTYLPSIARPPSPTPVTPSPSTEPSPSAEPTPSPPPPDFVSCAIVGDPSRAPNYPVKIVGIDKRAETVTLQNVSGAAVDLTGWRMCSVTGGQQHPISGTLAPGATQTFTGPAGLIWNNSSSDPGALWNAAGSLISYWPD
jgi:micrococcal nuclease